MSPSPADMADLGALAGLGPALATTVASIAGDIALVIGPDGLVRNVAQGDLPLSRHADSWVGKPFADAVTADTRGKITQLLHEASSTGVSRRREVNLPGAEGLEIPVAFAAIRLGQGGPVLAVGRDLRAIAAIQQRFVQAQQDLERDYWQRRQAESRDRLLFQVATDAVMMVHADTLQVVEANLAAAELLGRPVQALLQQPATAAIAVTSRPAVTELLMTARTSGRAAEIRARLESTQPGSHGALVDISAMPLRAVLDGEATHLLQVRTRRVQAGPVQGPWRLSDFVEQTPDAVVITDSAGRVLMANPAFLRMDPEHRAEAQLRGQALAEVLGDPGQHLAALLDEVRRAGLATQMRLPIGRAAGQGAGALEVQASAALLAEGDQECIGLTMRRHPVSAALDLTPLDGLAAAIEQLASQLGRQSLQALVAQATMQAERHLIRSALLHARGQAGAAAAWLGIGADELTQRLHLHSLDASGDPVQRSRPGAQAASGAHGPGRGKAKGNGNGSGNGSGSGTGNGGAPPGLLN